MSFLSQLSSSRGTLEAASLQESVLWHAMFIENPVNPFKNSNFSLGTASGIQTATDAAADFTILRALVQSITVPFLGIEVEKNLVTGDPYLSGIQDVSSFSMSFLETENFYIHDYMVGWRNSIYDPHDRVFKAGKHDKSLIVTFHAKAGGLLQSLSEPFSNADTALDAVAENAPSKIIVFHNVLPTSFDDWSLDYTSNDPLTFSVTFSVKHVETLTEGAAGFAGSNAESVYQALSSIANTTVVAGDTIPGLF